MEDLLVLLTPSGDGKEAVAMHTLLSRILLHAMVSQAPQRLLEESGPGLYIRHWRQGAHKPRCALRVNSAGLTKNCMCINVCRCTNAWIYTHIFIGYVCIYLTFPRRQPRSRTRRPTRGYPTKGPNCLWLRNHGAEPRSRITLGHVAKEPNYPWLRSQGAELPVAT